MKLRHAILTTILAVGTAAAAVSPAETVRHIVRCAGGRTFVIERGRGHVTLMLNGRRYQLAAKPSGLGQRFDGSDVVLIIDGAFVALVFNDDLNFRDCQLDDPKARIGQ